MAKSNYLAIWDNRSVYHAATPDYLDQDLGERTGQRAVSLGERLYLDPKSTGRREAIGHPLAQALIIVLSCRLQDQK